MMELQFVTEVKIIQKWDGSRSAINYLNLEDTLSFLSLHGIILIIFIVGFFIQIKSIGKQLCNGESNA